MDKDEFINISDLEWEEMKEKEYTWADIQEKYRQPKWCGYPEALNGGMGCWSLISRLDCSEDSCKKCECFRD